MFQDENYKQNPSSMLLMYPTNCACRLYALDVYAPVTYRYGIMSSVNRRTLEVGSSGSLAVD